jgi:hypothetical protein
MKVPEFGFGTHLDAMYDWHHTRGVLALHGSGWRDENGRYWISVVLRRSEVSRSFCCRVRGIHCKEIRAAHAARQSVGWMMPPPNRKLGFTSNSEQFVRLSDVC